MKHVFGELCASALLPWDSFLHVCANLMKLVERERRIWLAIYSLDGWCVCMCVWWWARVGLTIPFGFVLRSAQVSPSRCIPQISNCFVVRCLLRCQSMWTCPFESNAAWARNLFGMPALSSQRSATEISLSEWWFPVITHADAHTRMMRVHPILLIRPDGVPNVCRYHDRKAASLLNILLPSAAGSLCDLCVCVCVLVGWGARCLRCER